MIWLAYRWLFGATCDAICDVYSVSLLVYMPVLRLLKKCDFIYTDESKLQVQFIRTLQHLAHIAEV